MFFIIGVLKNFAIYTLESPFNKEKPVNITKALRPLLIPLCTAHLQWLLLKSLGTISVVKMLFGKFTTKKKNKHSWKNKVFMVEFIHRSTHLEVFCQKGVLKNFAKIHGKTPVPEPLFN